MNAQIAVKLIIINLMGMIAYVKKDLTPLIIHASIIQKEQTSASPIFLVVMFAYQALRINAVIVVLALTKKKYQLVMDMTVVLAQKIVYHA